MTDCYAVLGQPVAHSKSPFIHARFAAQQGTDLGYEALEVAPQSLEETLERLHAEDYQGINLTLPHKVAVAALCEETSERARLAGAVNTLLRTAGGWRGDNTDGEGFITDLKNCGLAVAGRRVLVLGAGGAARGILKPLLDEKPAELSVSNRNPWKPEDLAAQLRPYGNIQPRTHLALKGDRYDLIINATSAGHEGRMVQLPAPLLAEGGAAYDLSYGLAHQPFAAWARTQQAASIHDGIGMLVEQAAAAYALWRGQRPQTAPVIAALRAGG